MSFTLVQAGGSLYSVGSEGTVSSALTLPTGITLSSNRIPRFARYNNMVVVVNTPSRPLTVDPSGTVRVLTPTAPSTPVSMTGSTGGTLSGTFRAKHSFIVLDSSQNVISESDFSDISTGATITSKYLSVSNINISQDSITARRLYRTTDNGSVYFPWIDLDGNSSTTLIDDKSDAALQLVAAPTLGTPPDLTLIAQWNGRLWGVDRSDIDHLRYSEAGVIYAWPGTNSLPIPHLGGDRFGIMGLMPRRDALGVARKNNLVQVTGNLVGNIRQVNLSENCGVESPESIVTFRDSVFFLWQDGVYLWDANGLTCISDAGGVRSWFATNSYFNRGMFSQAFAILDYETLTYQLFLCSAGGTTVDKWVEYNLNTGKWYGPHSTTAFTPSCAVKVRGRNDKPFHMIGSRDGYLSQSVAGVYNDWKFAPIDMEVVTKSHDGGDPDRETYFGELSVHGEAQATGAVTISPIVGELDAVTGPADMTWDLTLPRQRLPRLGVGKHVHLVMSNNVMDENVVIYGYTIPFNDVGRR